MTSRLGWICAYFWQFLPDAQDKIRVIVAVYHYLQWRPVEGQADLKRLEPADSATLAARRTGGYVPYQG